MTSLTVRYRRTFQHAAFNQQDIDLQFAHEFEGTITGFDPKERAQAKKLLHDLYKDMEEIGDNLMLDSLGKKPNVPPALSATPPSGFRPRS